MANNRKNKFGSFSGVFTPSILTILGVIMYMRLGWITANSGLVITIVIILVAHIISVTTGLSISSIATDKKIKTGGIYYILSRSLGLPIGGAIGLTMFIGTALSISLYLIGFAENFLGIGFIRELTGLGETVNDYRIVGTVTVVILFFIAFIGTSVAIKTQFFIMAAIALSLLSVVAGFFFQESVPESPSIWPATDSLPFEVVFAIFFPAVTGFTAGVAMSGDLKDPRKNIPFGTLSAIVVGLIVYVSLSVGLAYFVDRDLMLADNNFLMKIAWFGPLVVAGIWGATLSSAIGGLLGAPRILQAISKDKITPKFFSRGYGINNEPRNALLFTLLLAEAGILIGELDVIASIVSMFYIAAYGFINIAFALEKWASTDFRPSFKISRWVGIIGFIACFIVMFRIDPTAMLAAIIVLWFFYYFIKKKKLELDFGDVWSSVWTSIVRSTLNNITKRGLEERNWRPNIILFSGGTTTRPHLIEFGLDLTVNRGMLSNFDLILNRSAEVLLKKHEQVVPDEISTKHEGIYTRRHECKDIYEGIETIAGTYGFSGVEPNTVLMGWGRQSQDPLRFAQMIRTLSDLDLNIIMLDYDKSRGFGNYKTIDIWCRGGGNNCSMVLSLIRFLWISENWKEASVRILLINPENEKKDELYENTSKILENLRIDASIKIINNQIEQRPVNEIILIESFETDLIFLGISEVKKGDEFRYVETVNKLCQNVGTVVLVKASSYFKNFEIGAVKEGFAKDKSQYLSKKGMELIVRKAKTPEISYPDQPILAEHIRNLLDRLNRINEGFQNRGIADLFSAHPRLIYEIKLIIDKYFERILTYSRSKERKSGTLSFEFYHDFISESSRLINENISVIIEDQGNTLDESLADFVEKTNRIPENTDENIIKVFGKSDLEINRGESFKVKWFKFVQRIGYYSSGKPVTYKIKFRKLLENYIPVRIFEALVEVLHSWGLISLQFTIKIRKFNRNAVDCFMVLEQKAEKGELDEETIMQEKEKLDKFYDQLMGLNESSRQSLSSLLNNKIMFTIQKISNDLSFINTNTRIFNPRQFIKRSEKLEQKIREIPGFWSINQELNFNAVLLNNDAILFMVQLRSLYLRISEKAEEHFNNVLLKNLHECYNLLNRDEEFDENMIERLLEKLDAETNGQFWNGIINSLETETAEILKHYRDEFSLYDRQKYEDYRKSQFSGHNKMDIKVRALLEDITKNEFISKTTGLIKGISDSLSVLLGRSEKITEFMKEMTGEKEPENAEQEAEINLRMNNILDEAGIIISELENNSAKVQNHIKERITAMSDRLSTSSLLSYYIQHRRKIK